MYLRQKKEVGILPMLRFICEICGKEFEASHRRKQIHCPLCAESLRSRGLGPRQQISQTAQRINPEVKEIDWSSANNTLLYYLERFNRYSVYDGIIPNEMDLLTDDDRHLANQIAARMGIDVWMPIIGQSISNIQQWDLLSMTDIEWQCCKEVVRKEIPNLLHKGIGIARLTKALHRKRPQLIPICDSVLCKALNVGNNDEVDTLVECMSKLRSIGQANEWLLGELQMKYKAKGYDLSELRILEILYWVQYGPFPVK